MWGQKPEIHTVQGTKKHTEHTTWGRSQQGLQETGVLSTHRRKKEVIRKKEDTKEHRWTKSGKTRHGKQTFSQSTQDEGLAI